MVCGVFISVSNHTNAEIDKYINIRHKDSRKHNPLNGAQPEHQQVLEAKMKNMSVELVQNILKTFSQTPARTIKRIIDRGLLTDVAQANADVVNRAQLRKVLGIKSLLQECVWHQYFEDKSGFRYLCKVYTDMPFLTDLTELELVSMQNNFDLCFPEHQSVSEGGTVYVCKSNGLTPLQFARHISGARGTVERVAELLTKNGQCVNLFQVEDIIGRWFSKDIYINCTTAGLIFFVQNLDGKVYALHLRDFSSRCVMFVLRTLDECEPHILGHEQYLVKEPQ
jgi:hypothetical protein